MDCGLSASRVWRASISRKVWMGLLIGTYEHGGVYHWEYVLVVFALVGCRGLVSTVEAV